MVFDFRLGRGREGPKRFLGQFEGILQTDGYAAYDQIGGPRIVPRGVVWSQMETSSFRPNRQSARVTKFTLRNLREEWRDWNALPPV